MEFPGVWLKQWQNFQAKRRRTSADENISYSGGSNLYSNRMLLDILFYKPILFWRVVQTGNEPFSEPMLT